MTIERTTLVNYLDSLLNIKGIADVSCNGLQVEGPAEISRIGLAVDACQGVFTRAAELGCQMVLAHHGIIWGGLKCITGPVYKQVSSLITSNVGLYAAHLPLDVHPTLGNNAVLAHMLNLEDIYPFGEYHGIPIGYAGALPEAMSAEDIGDALQKHIGGTASMLPFGKKLNRTVAIVSGGGSDALPEAIANGIDCFITGEPSHWNHHAALEAGINVIYSGHYNTETVGVRALGNHLQEIFEVDAVFIDEPTLV